MSTILNFLRPINKGSLQQFASSIFVCFIAKEGFKNKEEMDMFP